MSERMVSAFDSRSSVSGPTRPQIPVITFLFSSELFNMIG